MRSRKKLACYLMLVFVISLGCAEAKADSSPDEIVAAELQRLSAAFVAQLPESG